MSKLTSQVIKMNNETKGEEMNRSEKNEEENNASDKPPAKIKGIVIGAGSRGRVYSQYAKAFPSELEIVGVADPRPEAVRYMRTKFDIEERCCFKSWEPVCEREKFADCVLICTQDQMHAAPAIALAKKGYHILLEKPMATTSEDCKDIYNACQKNNVKLAVCHVLRYHPSVKKLKELIDSGLIGEVVNISHVEPVGYWHFAHSFVRGNWANESQSTFSLLAKCCHDVDLICYWMSKHKCTKVSSFGSLQHFKKENKPEGASTRCLDCKVESTCPYSAKKIYLDPRPLHPTFPMDAVCDIEDSEEGYMFNLEKAVKKGPYGKCVYEADNDVCDNQVVNFEFSNGATASLTMIAFSKDVCQRKTTVYGTKGELSWNDFYHYTIQHYDFLTEQSRVVTCKEDNPGWGHGGSDFFTIKNFVTSLSQKDDGLITTGPEVSLASHLLTFAAEHSRVSGQVIDLENTTTWQL